jgi:cytochrome b
MARDRSEETVKVWDPAVRLFHWSLVVSFFIAWLSADEVEDLHEWAGYAAGTLVAFRLLIGLVGSHYARFSQFLHGPGAVLGFVRDMLSGREARYIGHNPPGGMMVVTLLAGILTLTVTGILLTSDADFDTVEDIHEAVANIMLILVALHVGGVLLASLRHGENLIRAMLTGRKRAPEPGDIA